MDKYIVVGLGVFGRNLAIKLIERGAEVVAVDSKMALIEEIQDKVTYTACLDSSDEKSILELKLDDFDAGIVCIGENFQANILTSVLLKQNGVKKVISRASSPIHIKILKAVGIDQIITPEVEASEKLANSLMNKSLMDIAFIGEKTAVAKIKAPSSFVGKTIGSLKLRSKYCINVISIHRIEMSKKGDGKKEELVNDIPSADTVIEENDILVVIGDTSKLKNLS